MDVGWVDLIEEWALSLRHEDRERASPQPMYADGTLRENVAFGATEVADDKRVTWALERAQLGDWIGSLPEGLDTMVGESGKLVSGGQRQRVAIARSLYRDPQFLILDEATSDVDAATESALLDTLNSLSAQMTTVIVSH